MRVQIPPPALRIHQPSRVNCHLQASNFTDNPSSVSLINKEIGRNPCNLRISLFENRGKPYIDLRLKFNGCWLRVNRAVPFADRAPQKFKTKLKEFLLRRAQEIATQDDLKKLFAEFYLAFTGKPLPERPKTKNKEEEFINFRTLQRGTLNWLLSLYLQHTKIKHSPKTWERHFELFKTITSHLGNHKIDKLTTSHLLEYQNFRKLQKVSNRTINLEIGLIRKALNWALNMGLIENHGVKKFPMLPENKRLHAYLTEEELQKLLSALNHHPLLKYRVLFNVLTGLRPKEIATLEWKDIDFENRLLFVRKKPENQIKDREERAIPFCETALEVLQKVRALNPGSRFVFGKNGRPVYEIKPQLERARKKAGIDKKVFPYMLRHTFAVLSLKAGINIYDLKTLMGHSDISTTERYLHTNPEFLKQAVKKLDMLKILSK